MHTVDSEEDNVLLSPGSLAWADTSFTILWLYCCTQLYSDILWDIFRAAIRVFYIQNLCDIMSSVLDVELRAKRNIKESKPKICHDDYIRHV